MQSWLFTREQLRRSPSARDGVDEAQERSLRKRTCFFIDDLGHRLRLKKLTIATATVFFHRFFARQSFRAHDRYMVAITCVFLAGKTEEQPAKLGNVLSAAEAARTKSSKKAAAAAQQQPAAEQQQPQDAAAAAVAAADAAAAEGEERARMREKVLVCERVVLHTVAFDLCVEHPYKHLPSLLGALVPSKQEPVYKRLAQASTNFVNDALRTDLCLQFPPRVIAVAALHLALKLVALQGETLSGVCEESRASIAECAHVNGVPPADVLAAAEQLMGLYARKETREFVGLRTQIAAESAAAGAAAPPAAAAAGGGGGEPEAKRARTA